jgi:hypothetical protein
MNIGMLWFDNDTKSELTVRVERAAAYYRTKYGRTPNLCFVHPSMLASAGAQASTEPGKKSGFAAGVEVRSNRSVLPNHFWIGVNSAAEVR